METFYLTDITGVLGVWLAGDFDYEVPSEVIRLLEKVYQICIKEYEINHDIEKYNDMLKEKYGENITVKIKSYIEDDGSRWYYFISTKYGESDSFETIEKAYEQADIYLDSLV